MNTNNTQSTSSNGKCFADYKNAALAAIVPTAKVVGSVAGQVAVAATGTVIGMMVFAKYFKKD